MTNRERAEKAAREIRHHGLLVSPYGEKAVSDLIERAYEEGSSCAWISVEKQLPPRHQNVWCLNRDGYSFEGRICCGIHKPFFTYPRGDGSPSNTAPNWIDVTHWRPLPEPPLAGQRSTVEVEKE